MTQPCFSATTILALAIVAAAQQSGKPTWNDWNAWNQFPEGAWVTVERDFRGEFKSTYTDTLTKKTVDRLTLKMTNPVKKDDKGADEVPAVIIEGIPPNQGDETQIEKSPKPFSCPTCKGQHKPSIVTEQKKEKLKVAGREVLCHVLDIVPFDCKGGRTGSSRWWLSKEVPGGLVRREWTAVERPGKVVDTVLDFGKQKKVESEGK